MKHKLLLYGLAVAAAGVAVWACQRERSGTGADDVEPTLTAAQARDFFEQQYAETAAYRTKASSERPTGLMPGDFTPLWDKATRGVADRFLEGVDWPIDPHFIFTAAYPEIDRQGDTVRRIVDIAQKLVVNRWHDHPRWEGLYAYIATLIPTPEYYARHKDYGRTFVNLGAKNGFSGLVIYHSIDGRFVNADKYRDGTRVAQAYDPAGFLSLSEALERLAPDLQIWGGTPAMYAQDMEIEALPVVVSACKTCKMQGCHCKEKKPECDCPDDDDNDDDKGKEEPPVTPVDPPGGGDGGGSGSDDNKGRFKVVPIEEQDCSESGIRNASGAQMMYNAFNNAGLQDFINAHINDNVEWGVALNYNSQTGTYEFGQDAKGETGNVKIITTQGPYVNSIALFHTHPASGQPHSITDVIGLISVNQSTKGRTTTSLIAILQGTEMEPIIYAIQIQDPATANSFVYNLNDDTKKQMQQDLQSMFNNIYQVDQSLDESYAYALSYLLDQYHTGVRILKYENGGFKQKETTLQNNTFIRTTCK